MKDNSKLKLFDAEQLEELSKWKEEWVGMPEFKQEDQTSFNSIIVHFATREDMDNFSKLVEQKLTYKTRSIWYPEAEIGRIYNKRYSDES